MQSNKLKYKNVYHVHIEANYDKSKPAPDVIACISLSRRVCSLVYLGSCCDVERCQSVKDNTTTADLTFSKLTHVLAVGNRF